MLLINVVKKIVFGIILLVLGVFLDNELMLLKFRNEKYSIVVLVIIGIKWVFLE